MMKTPHRSLAVIVTLVVLLAVPSCRPSQLEDKQDSAQQLGDAATVTRVIDGDTIEVIYLGDRRETVRYIGIDAPEKDEGFFQEATAANQKLVVGQMVRLERDVSERDRFGRLLRYVYVGDILVNAELVKKGYAEAGHYPPDLKHSDLLRRLQKEAQENGVGLWHKRDSERQGSFERERRVALSALAAYHNTVCHNVRKSGVLCGALMGG